MKEIIQKSLAVLRAGGIILYPTDTIWGLGCDATNDLAITKINQLKKRAIHKNMLVLISNDGQLQRLFPDIPAVVWDILDFATRPTSLILDNPQGVSSLLIADDNSLGVRKIKHDFCQALLEQLGKPIVSTSANLSTMSSPLIFSDIDPVIIHAVDYIVPLYQDERAKYSGSTIIKLKNNSQIQIIRK